MESSTSISNPFQGVFGVIRNTVGYVHDCIDTIAINCEQARCAVVTFSRDSLHLPDTCVYLIERISRALPEVFAALGAVFGGVFVLPAMAISWGRKIKPMMPIIMNVLHGEVSVEQLVPGVQKTLQNFREMFDTYAVPAFFVAMVVDTIVSFTIGYLTRDMGRMLHASTIAMPGACLALAYMLTQKETYGFSASTASGDNQ